MNNPAKELQGKLGILKKSLIGLKQKLNLLGNKLSLLKQNIEIKSKKVLWDKFIDEPNFYTKNTKFKDDTENVEFDEFLRPDEEGLEKTLGKRFLEIDPNIVKNYSDLLNYLLSRVNIPQTKYGERPPYWYGNEQNGDLTACGCEMVEWRMRILLVMLQVQEFEQKCTNKQEKIVHTAFAEEGMLQPFLLMIALAFRGYSNLVLNVIAPMVFGLKLDGKIETFKKLFAKDFSAPKYKIDINGFEYASNYIDAVNKKTAPRSNSFDLVDVNPNPFRANEHAIFIDFCKRNYSTFSAIYITKSGLSEELCKTYPDLGKWEDIKEQSMGFVKKFGLEDEIIKIYLPHNLDRAGIKYFIKQSEDSKKTICKNFCIALEKLKSREEIIKYCKNNLGNLATKLDEKNRFSDLFKVLPKDISGSPQWPNSPLFIHLGTCAGLDFQEMIDGTSVIDETKGIICEAFSFKIRCYKNSKYALNFKGEEPRWQDMAN
jgi:hypothetical protein